VNDLVLLHGWGFGSRVWLPVRQHLAVNWRVALASLPDYDGSGTTGQELPANATVCAWSLGALQAMEWAIAHPDKVARLVLVGATPRFVQAPDWPYGQPMEFLDRFGADVAADATAALRRFGVLLNRGDKHAPALIRALNKLLDHQVPDVAILAAGLATLRCADFRQRVGNIRQPTLVVHGQCDPLMPVAAGRWLAQNLPAGQLEVVAGTAHAPFLSQPARFARLLAEFARG
jgi:pimeloyl-[acyl-carrier protein] methyl ester esterase